MSDLLTPREAANELRTTEAAIARWRQNDRLKPTKIDRTTGDALFSEQSLSEYAARQAEYGRWLAAQDSEFTFIDLFAGIGGLRIGFEAAGGACVFSSEIDRYACQTYAHNFHGDWPDGDITKTDVNEIPAHDVLVAGFPCQPFSIAGVSKYGSLGWGHGFLHETKGTLFFDVVRILEHHRPRAFLLENVKNLKNHDRGQTWKVIQRALEELGYFFDHRIIDAQLVVPQHRERIFIVGFRDIEARNQFAWPEIPDMKRRVRDILDPEPVDPKYTLTDHLWQYLQDYAEKHRRAGNGFGFGLVDLNGVTRTLSARYYKDGSEILIPQEGCNPRRLTPAECARLMGFPDGFRIPVSDTQAYKQFGNAVVAEIAKHIARAVIDAMLGRYPATTEPRQLVALETAD